MIESTKQFLGRKVTILNSGTTFQYTISSFRPNGTVDLRDDKGILVVQNIQPDRLELVPLASLGPKGYHSTDHFIVTPDEATEQLAFSLMQAAIWFQNAPSKPETREEFIRLLTVRGHPDNGPVVLAAIAYYDAANKWYDDEGNR